MLRDFWGEVHLAHSLAILVFGTQPPCCEEAQTSWRGPHEEELCRGSQGHPQVWWFTMRSHRTQHTVVLATKIYYMRGYSAKSAKGKGVRGKVRRNRHKSLESSPCGVTQDALNSSSNELWPHVWNGIYTGGRRDNMPKVFMVSWSCRHPLPSMSQDSRPPEGGWYLA